VTRTGLVRLVATDLDGTLLRSGGLFFGADAGGAGRGRVSGYSGCARDSAATAVAARYCRSRRAPRGSSCVPTRHSSMTFAAAKSSRITAWRPETSGWSPLMRNALPGIVLTVESRMGFARERDYIDEFTTPQDVSAAMLEESLDPLPGKLLARCDDVPAVQFHKVACEVVGDHAVVSYSGASGLAEISAAGVTKAAALEVWCSTKGIDAAGVFAFGDMPNDLPMLSWAGRSLGVERTS
jgi:hypothetical protein